MSIGAAYYVDDNKLREKALNHTLQHVHYEDENTIHLLDPVDKVNRSISLHIDPPFLSFYSSIIKIIAFLKAKVSISVRAFFGGIC
jgi:hypothetical protein